MRKQWILFLLLGTSIAISNAQNQERLEFDLRPNEPQPEIVPIESQGFIIFNPAKERKEDGIAHMALSFYDTSFKKIWEKDVASNKKLNLTFYEHFEDTFYLIFSNSSKEILEVATIEPASGNITHYEFYVVKGTDIQDFVVHQNQLIIGGTIKNMPLIQKMDLNTQKTITLPSIVEGKQVSVNELFINEKTNQVSAVISSSFDKTKNVIVRTFGNERNQFEDLVITSDQNYDFHTAKITEISKEEKLVMGSYGFRNSANTQGFYMAKFINFAI